MDDKKFCVLWNDAAKSADRDAFVSDWALSSIFGDESDEDIQSLAEQIGNIWDVAHMSVRDLCSRVGIGQSELSRRFCIPLRTVQNWCGGQNPCPPYVVLMMARLFGMI